MASNPWDPANILPQPAPFAARQDESSEEDHEHSEEQDSSSSEDQEIYPPGFPLSPEVYELHDLAEDEADDDIHVATRPEDIQRDNDRLRLLNSQYPYSFLDPNGIWRQQRPEDAQLPLGQLHVEGVPLGVQRGNQVQYVEYVPPWTDPDWSKRFTFTGEPGTDPGSDPQYNMYAKEGLLQGQRPALRAEDGLRDLTPAAKRYGVDATMIDQDAMYGNSGVTPRQERFSIPLDGNPRVTPSNQGVKDRVDSDDYDALFTQYRNSVSNRGGLATEDDFRRVLSHVTAGNMNPALGPACDAQVAGAILRYMDGAEKVKLREEYQRVIFGGSTSDELVETGVWTMDQTADSDLVTPLHDLLTRDKWEVTNNRGTVLSQRTGAPRDTRKVYNFPTQQGEWCAANDYLWLAMQPALQLASMVLNSDHPVTWAWADIYRMRPCHDGRQASNRYQILTQRARDAGVERKDFFAVYAEEDPDEFYPEVERLKELGFSSIRWACEILRRCLTWEINAKFTGVHGQSDPWEQAMGWTTIIPSEDPNSQTPFVIRISISADFIWPLLIEEYSQAEKAACSFTLAATIVHELCHAILYCRNQLFHEDSVWLRFNPNWVTQAFGQDGVNSEALGLLKVFGCRQIWDDELSGPLVLIQEGGHDFFEEENTWSEEGFATENQYWGGSADTLNRGTFLPMTRFIREVITMVSLADWPKRERPLYKAIPLTMYTRFFTQSFWDQEMQKWGPEAMRMYPLTMPRAYGSWNVFRWRHVEARFGFAARAWMETVADRVRWDDEHALLWAWLRELCLQAVEPKQCMIRCFKQQSDWKMTDKMLWRMRNAFVDKADQLFAYMQRLYSDLTSAHPLQNPLPPEFWYFREAFAAVSGLHRALGHDASLYQAIAVDYHKQREQQTKTDIRNFYGAKLVARLDGIHGRIALDCIEFLDRFEQVDPIVYDRLSQNARLLDVLDNDRRLLREKFKSIQDALAPVRQTFSAHPGQYALSMQNFAFLKPAVAVDNAAQIEVTARKQLRTLSGPLLRIAQGWVNILEHGERLRNPPAGSQEAAFNTNLRGASDYIMAIKQRQDIEATRQNPPSEDNMFRMLSNPAILQPDQMFDGSTRNQRFNTTAGPGQINAWQAVYAEASGFVPYHDPVTGFTRFYRANIPTEAGPSVNPGMVAQAQAQGQGLVGALAPGFNPQGGGIQPGGGQFPAQADPDAAFNGLMQGLAAQQDAQPGHGGQPPAGGNTVDAMRALLGERGRQVQQNPALAGHVVPSIYNRAMQAVAGPNGAGLINSNLPGASNLFGVGAAQSSFANQQMEALIRQTALGPDPYATLGSMDLLQVGAQPVAGISVAPAVPLYDPVGGDPSQAFWQGQQPVPNPQQAQFPPGGAYGPSNLFPPPQAPQFPPPGGYQGPNMFPPPQWGYQGQQQGGPPGAGYGQPGNPFPPPPQ